MKIESSLSQMLLAQQERAYQSSYPTHNNSAQTGYLRPGETDQQEPPVARTEPRDIVEFNGIEIDLEDFNATPEDEEFRDIRHTSARDMVDLSLDLYIDGIISFDEYSMLAFQPELHPKFDETIGALTGERAEPDRKRDFISEWEERYNFERKYPGEDSSQIHRIERILSVLSTLDAPMDFSA